LAGIIAGGLAVALLLGTMHMIGSTMATEADTQAKEAQIEAANDAAKSSKNLADKIKEEYKELKKLNDEYEEAKKIWEETATGKETLDEKARKLAEGLEIENRSILILTENYEKLNTEIEKSMKLKAEEQVSRTKTALSGAFGSMAAVGERDDGDGFSFESVRDSKSGKY
jgi:hypothetical protein